MSDLYEVEAILLSRPASAKSRKKGAVALDKLTPHEREYYIKWKGYSIIESTWEPYENLKNVKTMVTEFIDHDEKLLAKNPNYKKMISNPEFACQALTDKRMVNGKEEYLVRWSDFEQETWEDASNLPTEAIDEYEQKRNEGGSVGGGGVGGGELMDTSEHSNSPSSRKRNLYQQQQDLAVDDYHHHHHHQELQQQQRKSAKQEEAYDDFGAASNHHHHHHHLSDDDSSSRGAKKRRATRQQQQQDDEDDDDQDHEDKYTKKRRLAQDEVKSALELEREKLPHTEQVMFDLIMKHDWTVAKVLKGKVSDFDVKVSHGELTQQFPLKLFRLVHPQKVIDFFLAKTKFSSPTDRQSLGAQARKSTTNNNNNNNNNSSTTTAATTPTTTSSLSSSPPTVGETTTAATTTEAATSATTTAATASATPTTPAASEEVASDQTSSATEATA